MKSCGTYLMKHETINTFTRFTNVQRDSTAVSYFDYNFDLLLISELNITN